MKVIKKNIDLSIIVPIYNEEQLVEDNISKILNVFFKKDLVFEIIIIDDGSDDGTYIICKELEKQFDCIQIFSHSINKGYSKAVKTGIMHSRGNYISYLDVDLQYDPKDLFLFYTIAKQTKYYMITGKTNKSEYNYFRRLVSFSHNVFIRTLFPKIFHSDINSMKLFKKSILDDLIIHDYMETIGLQLLLAASQYNPSILTVPIDVIKRQKGKSKFKFTLLKHGILNSIKIRLNYKFPEKKKTKILLTFDLEEWRLPEHYNNISEQNGNSLFSYEGASLILEILEKYNIVCTFFTTGYFAKKHPDLVQKIINLGHEIASHSYYDKSLSLHKNKYSLSQNIEKSIEILEKLVKDKIFGFRAPQFSKNKYLFDVLQNNNLVYDSSIHPAFLPGKYIDFKSPLQPYIIRKDNKYILEIPCSVIPSLRLPISWWWMRNIGLWVTIFGTKKNLKRAHNVVIYLHPWEFVNIKDDSVPLHITKNTGVTMCNRLEKYVREFSEKGYEFTSIKELYIK
tara:strand:+ start:4106 stop:5635 length:1530 start_codon:yes stop_codon:yes gene_type:complete